MPWMPCARSGEGFVWSGIYGMNFEYLPGTGWRWGSAVAFAAMAASALTLYRTFKRTGWL